MRKSFKEKYQNMAISDLELEIAVIRKDIFSIRIRKISNNVTNCKLIRNLRKALATLLTFLVAKRKALNNE